MNSKRLGSLGLVLFGLSLASVAQAAPGGGKSGAVNQACTHKGAGTPGFCGAQTVPEIGAEGSLAALALVLGGVAVVQGTRRRRNAR